MFLSIDSVPPPFSRVLFASREAYVRTHVHTYGCRWVDAAVASRVRCCQDPFVHVNSELNNSVGRDIRVSGCGSWGGGRGLRERGVRAKCSLPLRKSLSAGNMIDAREPTATMTRQARSVCRAQGLRVFFRSGLEFTARVVAFASSSDRVEISGH